MLVLRRKTMANLDSVFKSRDITLPTQIHIIKAMVFPVVMYRCEKVKMKVDRSCPTLCNPNHSTGNVILQAKILEWVAFPFSRGSSQPSDQTQASHITEELFTS